MDRRRIDLARELLELGLTPEALGLYEEHLEANDEDHEARLEYGIACLLDGDGEKFVSIGMEYAPCMSPRTLDRLGDRFRSLWAEYAGTCARLARASAVGVSVAMACQAGGCSGKPARPDAIQASDVASQEPLAVEADPALEPKPQSSVPAAQAADAQAVAVDATEDQPQQAKPDKPKPAIKPRTDFPKTKYVAVHIDKDGVF